MKRYSAVKARPGTAAIGHRRAEDRLIGKGALGVTPEVGHGTGPRSVHALLDHPFIPDAGADIGLEHRGQADEVVQHVHHGAVLLLVPAEITDGSAEAGSPVERVVAEIRPRLRRADHCRNPSRGCPRTPAPSRVFSSPEDPGTAAFSFCIRFTPAPRPTYRPVTGWAFAASGAASMLAARSAPRSVISTSPRSLSWQRRTDTQPFALSLDEP